MKVLLLGGNGMLGPHVVKALENEHELRISDIDDMETGHEYIKIDVSDCGQVIDAAAGMDAIINLSVLRKDRKLAFDVNSKGCYNMMMAAVQHGIRRVINTGPHFTIAGRSYEYFDYMLSSDIPPHPGTYLYALTKSLGQEICRVFSETYDCYVITLLYYGFYNPGDHSVYGQDIRPFMVTWSDAAEAVRAALDIDLEVLPSRCEVFNISADMPHQKFSNEKAKKILGWRPVHSLEKLWRK